MIGHVEITDFRAIAHAVVTLAKINVITGPNKAGKSSFLAAIEYLLTCRNAWCDGRGVGLKSQVRHGRKSAHLKMHCAGIDVVAQCPPQPNGKQSADQVLLALALRHGSNIDEDMAQTLLRVCGLLDMRPADNQKALLCRALKIEKLHQDNYNPMVNTLDERWPDLADWFDEETSKHKVALTTEAFLGLCKRERPVSKRLRDDCLSRLQQVQAKVRTAPTSGSPEKAVEARKRRDDLVKQIAELDAAGAPDQQVYQARLSEWRTASMARTNAAQTVERYSAEVESAEKHLASLSEIPASVPWRSVPVLEEALAAQDVVVKECERKVSAAFSSSVDFSSICAPGECRARQAQEAQQQQQRLNSELSSARAQLRVISGELELARRIALAQEALSSAQRRLVAAQGSLEQLPDPGWQPQPPDATVDPRLTALREQLAALDQQLEIADAMARQVLEYEHECGERDRLQEEYDRLSDVVARWECLHDAFDPKEADSIPSRLLRDGIGPFLADVDAACRKYFGFGVEIDFEPWQISIVHPTGSVPQQQACGGERVFLSAVMQVELAKRTGFSLVMIDEAQRLDAERRPMLASYLLQHDVQAIIALAAQEKILSDGRVEFLRPTPPANPDIAFFWAENGAIESIAPVAKGA